MDLAQAQAFAKYRLFRPLAFRAAHHGQYSTDQDLAKAIARWASKVMLGGRIYDLGVTPHGVFQVQSSRANRMSYLMPVWDPKLCREIVLGAKYKTARAKKGCGLGELEQLDYLGGILFLNRVYFRGSALYSQTHASKSGWFVEDRYHFDVFLKPRSSKAKEAKPEGQQALTREPGSTRPRIEPLLRVFHDSVGCVASFRWSPGPDIDAHNQSVKRYTPEYFPEASEVIMYWHELAAHLKADSTGVYALSNFIASELERGMHYLAVGSSFLWGEKVSGQTVVETDLSRADDTLWTAPDQPISAELLASYDRFFTRPGPGGTKQYFKVDTRSDTRLFESNLSAALIRVLLARASGAAEYIGAGYFRLKVTDPLPLAAGTGHWGSAEYEEVGISTSGDQSSSANTGGAGGGDDVQGGIVRLVVDGFSYKQREEIEAAVVECRKRTSAECQECVEDSVGDTYHDLGVAADLIDVIGGIAACVLTAIYGGPVAAGIVCGITLPAAGNAAKDFWDNTFGGYDYAEDMCSGLPDQSPTYTSPGGAPPPSGSPDSEKEKDKWRQECITGGGTPYVERIQREDACLSDPKIICQKYSRYNEAAKRLVGAVCKPGASGETDEVICVWCVPGVG